MQKGSGEETESQKVPAYSCYALSVLFLVYLVNFVDRQILSILANDIKADLGVDDAQLGFLYGTAFAIFYALFGIPLGRLADGWHRLRLLSIGLALWSIMTVLSGLSRSMATLTVARIGVGVGEASANPSAYSLIADWFPKGFRATALSIYSAGLFVGSGLSLLIGGSIVEAWNAAYPVEAPLGLAGWQAAFIIVGSPGILLALWVLSLREPVMGALEGKPTANNPHACRDFLGETVQIVPPFTVIGASRRGGRALLLNLAFAALMAAIAAGATALFGNAQQFAFVAVGYYAVFSWGCALRAADRETFAMTWQSPAFIAIVLVYAAVSYIGYSITYWAAPYAERTFALSKADLGWLVGAPNALGGFLGVILGGWLADRLGARIVGGRMLVAAITLLSTVPLLLLGYSSASSTVFLICNFLGQMVTAAALGACAASSISLVKPRMRGTATAIFLLGATLIGLAFGPFAAGLISATSGNLALGVQYSLIAVMPGLVALWVAVRGYPHALARLEQG